MKNSDLQKILSSNPEFANAFNKLSPEEQEKFVKGVKKQETKKEAAKGTGPREIIHEDNGLS